jgi:coenzyme F420-reducing hydrogenase beta subunit
LNLQHGYIISGINSNCFGCEACAQICPQECIELKYSFNRFWYPVIDVEKCTNCNLCKKVCPYEKIENILSSKERPVAYAARTKNNGLLEQSTSGGIFTELSMPILEEGGVVFGAVLTDDFKVIHQSAVNIEQLAVMRGSKYVQSRIGQTYKEAKEYLGKSRPVLFTGTPCQIAGLKTFLGKNYNNLTTVDLICHGVLAPDVAIYHIKALEKEFDTKAVKVKFRDKQQGWKKSLSFCVEFENGQSYCRTGKEDRFYNMFLSNYDLRECCFECPFTKTARVGDITLGDFWGIEHTKPHLFDDKGHSLVLLNSIKGEEYFSKILPKLIYEKAQLEQSEQQKLKRPTEPDIWRDLYLRSVLKNGLEYTVESFSRPRPLWKKGIRYFQRKFRKII